MSYASRLRYADLHTHTYHSDGTRSPAEVVDVALAHGIEILAISDHDNLAAYFEIKTYADSKGVTPIPATELSCAYEVVEDGGLCARCDDVIVNLAVPEQPTV